MPWESTPRRLADTRESATRSARIWATPAACRSLRAHCFKSAAEKSTGIHGHADYTTRPSTRQVFRYFKDLSVAKTRRARGRLATLRMREIGVDLIDTWPRFTWSGDKNSLALITHTAPCGVMLSRR